MLQFAFGLFTLGQKGPLPLKQFIGEGFQLIERAGEKAIQLLVADTEDSQRLADAIPVGGDSRRRGRHSCHFSVAMIGAVGTAERPWRREKRLRPGAYGFGLPETNVPAGGRHWGEPC